MNIQVPNTYAAAKAMAAALWDANSAASRALGQFPTGPMGLTPDEVKATPEFQAAKAAFDRSFQALRRYNGAYTRIYKHEIRADRRGRFAAKGG